MIEANTQIALVDPSISNYSVWYLLSVDAKCVGAKTIGDYFGCGKRLKDSPSTFVRSMTALCCGVLSTEMSSRIAHTILMNASILTGIANGSYRCVSLGDADADSFEDAAKSGMYAIYDALRLLGEPLSSLALRKRFDVKKWTSTAKRAAKDILSKYSRGTIYKRDISTRITHVVKLAHDALMLDLYSCAMQSWILREVIRYGAFCASKDGLQDLCNMIDSVVSSSPCYVPPVKSSVADVAIDFSGGMVRLPQKCVAAGVKVRPKCALKVRG